jgi:hypothetical protein
LLVIIGVFLSQMVKECTADAKTKNQEDSRRTERRKYRMRAEFSSGISAET